jgi:hypothetical protein
MTFYVKKSADAEIDGPFTMEQINQMVREKRLRFNSIALVDMAQGLQEAQRTPIKQWEKLADLPGFVPDPDAKRNCLTIALIVFVVIVVVAAIGGIKLNDFLKRIH